MGLFKKHPKLNILIYNENHNWIAHCLDFDMMGISPISAKNAVDELIDLIRVQIGFAIQNDNLDKLLTPAPKEFWIKRLYAKKCSYRKLKELNNINIKEKKDNKKGGFISFNKAELCYV
ncbi:MAG: hypothetical protein ACYCSW_05325 [bacterium]